MTDAEREEREREAVEMVQEWMDDLRESKGKLWAIIVHEVAGFKAILAAFDEPGASLPDGLRERIVGFAARHTESLTELGELQNHRQAIIADADRLLELLRGHAVAINMPSVSERLH